MQRLCASLFLLAGTWGCAARFEPLLTPSDLPPAAPGGSGLLGITYFLCGIDGVQKTPFEIELRETTTGATLRLDVPERQVLRLAEGVDMDSVGSHKLRRQCELFSSPGKKVVTASVPLLFFLPQGKYELTGSHIRFSAMEIDGVAFRPLSIKTDLKGFPSPFEVRSGTWRHLGTIAVFVSTVKGEGSLRIEHDEDVLLTRPYGDLWRRFEPLLRGSECSYFQRDRELGHGTPPRLVPFTYDPDAL